MIGFLSIGNVESPERFIGDEVTSIQGFTLCKTVDRKSFVSLHQMLQVGSEK